MMKIKPYIFYLLDENTSNCLYVDSAGNIQAQSVIAAGTAQDVSLQHAPDGWMSATLGYSRNKRYYGFNRSYSDPLKLVYDAAYIARTRFYLVTGVETKLTLVILKYNDNPQPGDPTYKLYHKAPIDFPQKNDEVSECFSCNLLEGGILQMLKTYENTIFTIPCDGSIPENIKVNMDGMYFQDTFNYQILTCGVPTQTNNAFNIMPAVFLSNDGDNIGVIHNDPRLENVANVASIPAFVQQSPNYLFSAVRPTSVRIKGLINIQPTDFNTSLSLSFYSNMSAVIGAGILSHAGSLLTNANENYQVQLSGGPQTVYFDHTVNLLANENLFISVAGRNGVTNNTLAILGGSFTMTFASIAANTAPWALTAYDLFKLLVKNINQVASTQFQTFNFGVDSTLLQSKLNLVCTSGDAIRASGDPNYQKFYNAVQNNPNFPNINSQYSYGPVIKTSLADFFDSFNAILNASLGSQTLPGEGETVFFEKKSYVFDSSKDTFDLGEVSDFNVSVDVDKLFTILKIGYQDQQYDQKSGKYEWNTSLQMVSPIKSIPTKTLEITSKYRADAYAMERLRANIDKTSSTKNGSDNGVFILNTDQSSFIYDYFEMNFKSLTTDPTISTNTNLRLIQSYLNQGLNMSILRAGYFSVNNDPSILVLTENGLSASKTLAINIGGNLNGSPFNALTLQAADTVTINVFVNGVILKTYITTSTSPSTPISVTDSITRIWKVNDNIYCQATTSATGTAQIDSIDLNMATGYFDASGQNITVESGASNRMLALPTVSAPHVGGVPGTPVLSQPFQYFQFNSVLSNRNFTTNFSFGGTFNGSATPGIQVDLYLNGVTNGNTFAQNGSGGWQSFAGTFNFTRDWNLGDVMFVLGSNYSNLTTEFQTLDLKVASTKIKAFALNRVQYDYISGIPIASGLFVTTPITVTIPFFSPIIVNINTAVPLTTGPGAPYNIEDLTPKRMLLTHGNYLHSVLYDQSASTLKFSTLSKNQYLVTIKNGVNITENADVRIGDLPDPLFSIHKGSFKTRVPLTFAELMRYTANAFISWTYNGQLFYGFPEDMKQQATLNETQTWEALIA